MQILRIIFLFCLMTGQSLASDIQKNAPVSFAHKIQGKLLTLTRLQNAQGEEARFERLQLIDEIKELVQQSGSDGEYTELFLDELEENEVELVSEEKKEEAV